MSEPSANSGGPIRDLLDEFSRLPEARRTFIAGLISVILHLLLFAGGGILFYRLHANRPVTPPPKKNLEVVLVTPTPPPAPKPPKLAASTPTPTPAPTPKPEKLTPQESMLLTEKFRLLPEEIQREYVDVDGLARKKNLSKRALLESWADSVAGSVKPGKGDGPLPTQDGRDLPFNNFKDQQASLGKNLDPSSPSAKPPLPEQPQATRPIFQPQPIAKDALSPSPQGKPIPKVAEVAKTASKEESTTPPPPPSSRLIIGSAATPPPNIRITREAGPDEIPMFLRQPDVPKAPEFIPREKPQPQEQLRPTPAPTPAPKPLPTPEPVKIVKNTPAVELKQPTKKPEADEKLNVIQARLPNQIRPQPVQNPGYAPHQVMTKNDGGSAPPGPNGVDAVATLSGKYKKGLNSIVGSRWTHFVKDPRFSSLLSAGQTTLQFTIDARGKIIRVKVVDNTSNSAHAQLCERAFIESQPDIDAPPRGVLRAGVYEDTFTFVLY